MTKPKNQKIHPAARRNYDSATKPQMYRALVVVRDGFAELLDLVACMPCGCTGKSQYEDTCISESRREHLTCMRCYVLLRALEIKERGST